MKEPLAGEDNNAVRHRDDRMALSVVAPCHNEEENIDALLRRVSEVCGELVGDDYEIVLVNDGSADNTWKAICDAAQDRPNIVGINLSRNHGHQLALSAGLSMSRGNRILIIDADLQDPPELLSDMMKLMDGGADVVYGRRLERPGDSGPRKAASSVFYRLLRFFSEIEIPLDTGDFRLINRRVLDQLLSMPEHHRFIRGMISWVGFKQVPIFYERSERKEGKTSYSLPRLFSFAIDGITGFSIRPLRMALFVGLATAFISALYAIRILIIQLTEGVEVAGWSSLMVVILFLGAAQMIFLGLIGEYIGRVFHEVKGRPLFVISDVVSSKRPVRKS